MTIKNHSRICLICSVAVMLIALIMTLLGAGLNQGIDFAGGLQLTFNMNQSIEQADVKAALKGQGISSYQIVQSGAEGQTLEIRLTWSAGEEEIQSLKSGLQEALLEKYPELDTETATANRMGPTGGGTLLRDTAHGLLLIALFFFGYMLIRFGLSAGISATLGLLHDVLLAVSLTAILRIQVNAPFAAALFAVAGYSMISAIVVFSSIRENNRNPANGKLTRLEVASLSVKKSLERTIFVALTALVILVALSLLGVANVRGFSLPVVLGILSSLYSANMISGYLWACQEERRKARKRAKRKVKKA